MSKFLDYDGLEHYHSRVQGEIEPIELKVNELPITSETKTISDYTGGQQYVRYSDGVSVNSGNFRLYTIKNAGFVLVTGTLGFGDTVPAAIAFYSGTPGASTYMKDASVQASTGSSSYEAHVPDGCQYICITNRFADYPSSTFTLLKVVSEVASYEDVAPIKTSDLATKNLNYKPLQQGSINWSGEETDATDIIRTDFIDVTPGGTYVVYSNHGTNEETQYIFEYTEDEVYIKNTAYYQRNQISAGTGFTVGETTNKIRVRSSAGYYTGTSEIVVEKGTSVNSLYGVHTYSPYLKTAQDEKMEGLVDITDNYDISYPNQALNSNGSLTSLGGGFITRMYSVREGDVLYYYNGGGVNNTYLFYGLYSSNLPIQSGLVSSEASTNTSNYFKVITIPSGIKAIGISYISTRLVSTRLLRYSSVYDKIEPNPTTDISDRYYNEWINAYLNDSYNRAGSTGINCRLYDVTPGEELYIERKGNNNHPFFAFMNTHDIGTDGASKVVLASQSVGAHPLTSAEYKTLITVPEESKVLAVNFAVGYEPIIRSNKPTRKNSNTIFACNPENEIWPKLAHSKFKLKNTYTNLTLAYFSDIHGDSNNLARIAEFADFYKFRYKEGNYLVKYIDDVISTGDQIVSQNTDDFTWWAANNGTPFLQAIGNHDAWVYSGSSHTTATEQQCYEKFIAPYVANWDVTQPTGAGQNGYYPCYYYKDYSDAGVRVIVLDCMHYTTDGTSTQTETTPGTQDTWFKATLASAITDELAVVVVSHYPPFRLTLDTDNNFCETRLGSVLATDNINSLAPTAVANFINSGGEFIMWLGGHQHEDYWGSNTSYPGQVSYTIECAICDYYNEPSTERLEYTKTQDCFNIISFDTTNKVVKMFRVGNDRDAMLKHKGTIVYNYSTHTIVRQD